MNKYFKLAGYCVAVAVIGGVIGAKGTELTGKYSARVELVHTNTLLNGNNPEWLQNPVVHDDALKVKTVTDATGATLKNIPYGLSDEDVVKHFITRPEWKGHNFFGTEYAVTPVQKFGEKPQVWDGVATCVSWQIALDDKVNQLGVYSLNSVSALAPVRNDYLRQCAWNRPKDMTYEDKAATNGYSMGSVMQYCWLGLLALFGTIPAIWLGLWRLIGMAVRSAKKEIKGSK